MELATMMRGLGEGVRMGTVVEHLANRSVLVQVENDDNAREARIVKTSDAATLTLEAGDKVLLGVDASNDRVFVLGLIERLSVGLDASPVVKVDQHRIEQSGDVSLKSVPPPDVLKVEGQKIHIAAGEEVRITCGDGLILIDKTGKVIVRGSNVVSRARGSNKIKGASVAIN